MPGSIRGSFEPLALIFLSEISHTNLNIVFPNTFRTSLVGGSVVSSNLTYLGTTPNIGLLGLSPPLFPLGFLLLYNSYSSHSLTSTSSPTFSLMSS